MVPGKLRDSCRASCNRRGASDTALTLHDRLATRTPLRQRILAHLFVQPQLMGITFVATERIFCDHALRLQCLLPSST